MTTRSDMAATVVASLLLLSGAAVGPHGLALLTPAALSFIDPAAPIALAVFASLAVMRIQMAGAARHRFTTAALEATITAVVVASALLLVPPAVVTADAFPPWTLTVLALAIAAATSAAADDDIVPIIAGGILLAFIREMTMTGALLLAAQVVGIAVLVAAATWLLLSQSSALEEQRVSTFAGVLLLGGAADFLSLSALLCGAAAGACWRMTATTTREQIVRDLAYVSDSLLALVLILAGAHADYSVPAIVVGVAYAVLRTVGKLAGQWFDGRIRYLLPPGALGVAFALNLVRAFGNAYAPVLTVVVVGTLLSSVVAAVFPREVDA